MPDWRLPKPSLGVFWKKDRGNERLSGTGRFVSERAGGEDRGKSTRAQLEVLSQQTRGLFINEVI